MEWLRRILAALWKVLFIFNFVVVFLACFPLMYIFLQKRKWFKYVFVLKRFCSWWICFFSFIYLRKIWRAPKKSIQQPSVIIANHSSYLDIVISYLFLPHYFVFMGKSELLKAPLFGLLFKEMNIAVNRKSTTDAHRAFVKAGEEIDRGNSVYIFPEGTIASDAILKNFKNGAFKLAIDKQVPILVVTYLNNWKILQNGGFFKSLGSPGIARIVIHPSIPTKGMTDADVNTLRQKTYDLTKQTLEEYEKFSR